MKRRAILLAATIAAAACAGPALSAPARAASLRPVSASARPTTIAWAHPAAAQEESERAYEPPGPLDWLLFFAEQLVFFLLFSWWGWIILLLVLVPLLQKRVRTWERRRRFLRAREAELANPLNANARFQLGVIHYEGRQLRRALRRFREAVEIGEAHGSEVDPLLYRYLGHTLSRLGHHREAIVAYEAGLEEAPESGRGESQTGLGIAHQHLGDPKAAERWYRLACEANQSLLEPRLRLAALLERQGRTGEARQVLDEARSIRLPTFMRRQQRRWRLALLLWPLTRPLL